MTTDNKKIALFGGSFDPFHTDHLQIIKTCKNKLNFDQVWIIPNFKNPFKRDKQTTVQHCLAMINLGIKGLDYVKISDYELLQNRKSFTINTIKHYQAKYPLINFELIIGSDVFEHLNKWKNFQELIELIKINIFIRKTSNIKLFFWMIIIKKTLKWLIF